MSDRWEISEAMREGKLRLDVRGHVVPKDIYVMLADNIPPMDCAEDIILKDEDGVPLDEDCGVCGAEVRFVLNRARNTFRADSACACGGKRMKFKVRVSVPSGKLAFANDLRHIFPTWMDRYVNHNFEVRLTTEDYARSGCLHFFVGNSCPSVSKYKDKLYVGGKQRGARRKGSVCTDLWWVSAADHENLKAKAAERGQAVPGDVFIVDVEPGTYEATIDPNANYENPNPYAVIRRVGKATPPPPLPERPETLPLDAQVKVMMMAYPTLYRNRRDCLKHMFVQDRHWYKGRPWSALDTKHERARKRIMAGEEPLPERKARHRDDENPCGCNFSRPSERWGGSCAYCVPDDVDPEYLAALVEFLDGVAKETPRGIYANAMRRDAEEARSILEGLRTRFATAGGTSPA